MIFIMQLPALYCSLRREMQCMCSEEALNLPNKRNVVWTLSRQYFTEWSETVFKLRSQNGAHILEDGKTGPQVSLDMLLPKTQVGFNSRYWLHCHSNWRVSVTTIENLRWQLGKDIKFITLGKFVTLLVKNLRKNVLTKIVQQSTNYQSVYSHFFLSFGTNDVTHFPKITE